MSSTESAETIEYVSIGDTLANIALKDQQSAGLTTTSSILLSLLVMITFGINSLLLATILSRFFGLFLIVLFSYKLRNCILYLMFCTIVILNLIDVAFNMFISLLYLANGQWSFGEPLCRFNAWVQQVNNCFIILF